MSLDDTMRCGDVEWVPVELHAEYLGHRLVVERVPGQSSDESIFVARVYDSRDRLLNDYYECEGMSQAMRYAMLFVASTANTMS